MIKIKMNNVWHIADNKYVEMFHKYTHQNGMYREMPYIEGNITISRRDNNPYNPIYISIADHTYPICDWTNVKVFLTNLDPVDWYSARDYQTWAFFDYMYDDKPLKRYVSCGSIITPNDTIIDVQNLPSNIIFTIGRNDNNSIYYERNDAINSHVRISDNEWARLGYRGFYARMTMDPGIIVISPVAVINDNKINLPEGIEVIETNNPDEQCLFCATFKCNLIFKPCNHSMSCSECYKKLTNNNCPLCKTEITDIDIL
jgi:hypothetical protein